MKIREILSEYASSGASSAGAIASTATGLGGPMMPIIRRMPAGQSFFGMPVAAKKTRRKPKPKQS
jgi:hypothetical protein